MAIETQNVFNNEGIETLSNSEKVKKRYGTLCDMISKLENRSYIDDEWYKVTLLSTTSKLPDEYRNISRGKKRIKEWIIVIKEDMKSWNCYITNVFYNSEDTWSKNSHSVMHKRWITSWIQKSKGGSDIGINHNWWWTVSVFHDGEVAGFQKSDNLNWKDISPILSEIYGRYLDIKLPTQKQKNQEMKLFLERVENTNKPNADDFLDQALENMA